MCSQHEDTPCPACYIIPAVLPEIPKYGLEGIRQTLAPLLIAFQRMAVLNKLSFSFPPISTAYTLRTFKGGFLALVTNFLFYQFKTS